MNTLVIGGVMTAFTTILGALVAFWVRRIEGRDRIFRQSVATDMRVMYALKEDYGDLHSWALDVRAIWREQQLELKANDAIYTIRELPNIPAPHWRDIEAGVIEEARAKA